MGNDFQIKHTQQLDILTEVDLRVLAMHHLYNQLTMKLLLK